jgi:hypothetical protein
VADSCEEACAAARLLLNVLRAGGGSRRGQRACSGCKRGPPRAQHTWQASTPPEPLRQGPAQQGWHGPYISLVKYGSHRQNVGFYLTAWQPVGICGCARPRSSAAPLPCTGCILLGVLEEEETKPYKPCRAGDEETASRAGRGTTPLKAGRALNSPGSAKARPKVRSGWGHRSSLGQLTCS